MTKTLAIIAISLLIISVGLAEAKTVNTSQLYGNTINLSDGENLVIINDLPGVHSVISTDNSFQSTGGLSEGSAANIDKITAGTHNFYDGTDSNRNGTIIMTFSPLATVTTDKSQYTNELTLTVSDEHYNPTLPVDVIISGPDGSEFTSLTVVTNSAGTFSTPVSIAYNNPTGIYTITTHQGTKSATTMYQHGIIQSPVSENLTTDNSTQNTPESDSIAPSDSQTLTETPTQITQSTATNMTLTPQQKADLIAYLVQQRTIINLLIQFLNGTAS